MSCILEHCLFVQKWCKARLGRRWDMQDCGGDTWRVQVIAMRDIIKGEALLLRYIAGFPSSHFLMHYGFV